MNELALWGQNTESILPSNETVPSTIANFAVQLSNKDKRQIASAFESGFFEMALNYLWGKTSSALKAELATVGVSLIGEMLGIPEVEEGDDIEDILSDKDAIRLAEELGIVSSTDGMRLRQAHELISHFVKLNSEDADAEDINQIEAINVLQICVKTVLGKQKIEVANKFVDFRVALERETLLSDDSRVIALINSPYFYIKLAINVLMNSAKKNSGAHLDHTLANINIIIPEIWNKLRDTEKWQVGYTYAEAFNDGKTIVTNSLKTVLLKVKGFDFVPENLRSDTFIKAATEIVRAHEGMNNFYNEVVPVKNLNKLGSVIPIPAFAMCLSALLCVVLGNQYGISWEASAEAEKILDNINRDRWSYYINSVLIGDIRILNKLSSRKPAENWIKISQKYKFQELEIKNKDINTLINNSILKNIEKLKKTSQKIVEEYYSKGIA